MRAADKSMGSLYTNDSLTRFTHVCVRWRSVALRTPSVWNHLSVLLPQPNATTGLPIAAQLVQRSHPLALWMRISSGPYSRELTLDMLSPLFDIPHLCDRVVNLEICPGRHHFRFLYTRPMLRFPALESLDLNILQGRKGGFTAPILSPCWSF